MCDFLQFVRFNICLQLLDSLRFEILSLCSLQLLEFLRAILVDNGQEEVSEVFDPSSAMFVCNRWDQVPEQQREGVKENALNKLKDVWPKFDPRQVFFLSAMNAQTHFDANPGYITEDFEEVLKGLKDMFCKARHNAVNQLYR